MSKVAKKDSKKFYGTGKRKTSVARVFVSPGKGEIIVNHRPLDNYFGHPNLRTIVKQPLVAANLEKNFDLYITVTGGGASGQAGAIRLGIARAILSYEPELRAILRKSGLLTRDAREVERKKVGRHGARRGTQYSKR
jgi:small subunit ribosomal protein S9